MKPIKYFEDFLKEGVVKRQFKDMARADFLVDSSKNTFLDLSRRIKSFGIDNLGANSIIKDSYDSFMEIIRAIMLKEGYSSEGKGAHEAEVSYLRNLKIEEADVQFADQIRFFRNGIAYYGKILDKEYAEKVFRFMKYLRIKLLNIFGAK